MWFESSGDTTPFSSRNVYWSHQLPSMGIREDVCDREQMGDTLPCPCCNSLDLDQWRDLGEGLCHNRVKCLCIQIIYMVFR